MGYRRRVARAPRCSLKLYRRAHDQGLKAFAEYLKVCGAPMIPRKVKLSRVRPKGGK